MKPDQSAVTLIGDAASTLARSLATLFAPAGLQLVHVARDAPIPGSYWGPPEAGLVGDRLIVRADTPVHSALHEGCHYLCMDPARRAALDTDAGGSDLEECAVCYLSIRLAGQVVGYGMANMLVDMDRWGYTFRLGSARRWFEEDAADALAWLVAAGWLDSQGRLLRIGPA